MKKLHKKSCIECNKEFETTNGNKKLCQSPHPYICENCGEVFVHNKKKKTCSRKCQSEQSKKKMIANYEDEDFRAKHSAAINDPEVAKKRIDNYKAAVQEKYGEGITNTTQLKEVQDKMKSTMIERYGVEYSAQSEELYAKMETTNMERHGVKNAGGSELAKQTTIETNMEKYGVEWTGQLDRIREANSERLKDPEVQRKMSEAIYDKYGVRNIQQLHIDNYQDWENINDFILSKDLSWDMYDYINYFNVTLLRFKFIVELNELQSYIKDYNKYSNPELIIKKDLDNIGLIENIDYIPHDRSKISPNELDFFVKESNVGIEVSPAYYHQDKFVDKNYHYMKFNMALEQGIELYTLFDWSNKKSMFNDIYRSKNELMNVSEVKSINFSNEVRLHMKHNSITSSQINWKNKSLAILDEDKIVGYSLFTENEEEITIENISLNKEYDKLNCLTKLTKYLSNKNKKINIETDNSLTSGLWMKIDNFLDIEPKSHYVNHLGERFDDNVTGDLMRVYDCGHKLWRID